MEVTFVLSISYYLSLFPATSREKPRFMALASAVLSQAVELLSLIQSDISSSYDLDSAAGSQLDTLGALLNVPRPKPSTQDADYRILLRARAAVNHWDGTNETLPTVLEAAFPGRSARLTDNLDGTVTASISGSVPFALQDLFPVPAGIRLISA